MVFKHLRAHSKAKLTNYLLAETSCDAFKVLHKTERPCRRILSGKTVFDCFKFSGGVQKVLWLFRHKLLKEITFRLPSPFRVSQNSKNDNSLSTPPSIV